MFILHSKTYLKLVLFLALIISILFLPNRTLASAETPLEVNLSLNNSVLDIENYSIVKLTLINNSHFEIFGIDVDYQDNNFDTQITTNLPLILGPFVSTQGVYQIKPHKSGVYNLTYSINYSWKDDKGLLHNRIEIIDSDEISVNELFGFDWPNYLIPLIIGFLLGQIGTILTEWYRYNREIKLKVEQTNGILLAGMQAAKNVWKRKRKLPFRFGKTLL